MVEAIAVDQLKQYVNKIETLEEEKQEISQAVSEVFAEAKANGFDIKAMKQVLKLRKLDKNKLAEQDAMLELYREALEV
jgi:uncharacterized protein (UPF0335 family)